MTQSRIESALRGAKSLPGWLLILVLCCFSFSSDRRGHGLEPSTKVSQYGHTIWRLGQAGLSGVPTAIAQTTDGYIWVGTSDGLYRFDGVRFTRWISPEGKQLPNQDIYSLLGAHDGSLYVGTGGGLARLTQGRLYVYPNRLINIRPLIEDQQGTIWMGQRGDEYGSYVLCRVGDNQIACLGKRDGFDLEGGYSIFSDKPGSVWVGNFEGIDHWRQGENVEVYPFEKSMRPSANGYVTAFAKDETGALWAGVVGAGQGRGLLKFSNGKWKSYDTPQVKGSSLPVRYLLAEGNDTLWIGTVGNGIYKLHAGTLDHFDSTNGLTGDAINGFLKDREGNLWVLTDSGVDMFHDLSIRSFTTREGLSDDSAETVSNAADGAIWIGTRHALNIIQNQHVSILSHGHGLPTDSVMLLYRDGKGTMWMADEAQRLFRYLDGRFTGVKIKKDRVDYHVVGIAGDSHGGIWLSALDESLRENALLQIQGTLDEERYLSPDDQVVWVVPHPGDGLWVAGVRHGLFWFHDGRFEAINPKVFDKGVLQLDADSDGVWLFTVQHEIFRYQDGRAQRLTTQNGLPCDSGSQILDDGSGNHWFYLSCGIVQVHDDELVRWWQKPEYRMTVRVFDIADGFRPGYAKSVTMADGKIWSANGRIAQVFDTRNFVENSLPPPVHIERVIVNHNELTIAGHLRLPFSPREIEIDYAGLSYVAPDRVQFRYRLYGHDGDWNDVGTRRQAFYSDLRPGHYIFQVIASNNDGVWNKSGAILDFVVPPLWFQTLWFQFLCVLVVFALGYSLYLLRMRRYASAMKIRFEERLEERTRLARDLHDTLMQTIEASRLISHYASRQQVEPTQHRVALEQLSTWLEKASNQGRAFMRTLRGAANSNSDLYFDLRQIVEEHAQQRTIQVMFPEPASSRRVRPRVQEEAFHIGSEAIRNAYTHADATCIEIELHFEPDLLLSVKDNGKGMSPGVASLGREGHFGLRGMRERASRIGAKFSLDTSFGRGTVVTLRVPKAIAFENKAYEDATEMDRLRLMLRKLKEFFGLS